MISKSRRLGTVINNTWRELFFFKTLSHTDIRATLRGNFDDEGYIVDDEYTFLCLTAAMAAALSFDEEQVTERRHYLELVKSYACHCLSSHEAQVTCGA